MNGLQSTFGEQVDFIHLDIDEPLTLDVRTQFDLVDRSRYIFTDAAGNVVQRWFGSLNQDTVEAYIREFLANQST